jgi:hypothetical protein
MSHNEIIQEIMDAVHVANKHHVGKVMASRGYWAAGLSAQNLSHRAMKENADLGKLERCKGFFRIPGCKSNLDSHAALITQSLVDILCLPASATIVRERLLSNGLRPDSIVYLRKNGKGLCFFLECCREEPLSYLRSKYDELLRWKEAKQELSKLFGCHIPGFGFVAVGKEVSWATSFEEMIRIVRDG